MKKQTLIIAVSLLLAVIMVKPAVAQSNNTIEVSFQPQVDMVFTVGDPVLLTLSVRHPTDYHVIQPQLDEVWGDFVVHSQSQGKTIDNGDGTETTTQVIDLRAFAPGTFSTPPLTIKVSDSGGDLQEVSIPPTSVEITSVLMEGDDQLRDIKPQADLPYSNILPWIVAGLLGILGFAGFIFWRRRQHALLTEAVIDTRLPHEVALDQLRSIEGLRLPDQNRFKEHYTLLSDCIRTYMENRYEIPVLERTTYEIQISLKLAEIHPEVQRLFIELLTESDLVKFAKVTPNKSDALQALESARHIVEVTKPVMTENDSVSNGDQSAASTPGNGTYKIPENIPNGKEATI